jgi:hypothetical protein
MPRVPVDTEERAIGAPLSKSETRRSAIEMMIWSGPSSTTLVDPAPPRACGGLSTQPLGAPSPLQSGGTGDRSA